MTRTHLSKASRADVVRLMHGCGLERAMEIVRRHDSFRSLSVGHHGGFWRAAITDRSDRRSARAWRDAEAGR